jgi:hypothetical protein
VEGDEETDVEGLDETELETDVEGETELEGEEETEEETDVEGETEELGDELTELDTDVLGETEELGDEEMDEDALTPVESNSITISLKVDAEVPPQAIEVPVSPASIDMISNPVLGSAYPISVHSAYAGDDRGVIPAGFEELNTAPITAFPVRTADPKTGVGVPAD